MTIGISSQTNPETNPETTSKTTLGTDDTAVAKQTPKAIAALLQRPMPADYGAEQTAQLAAPLSLGESANVCSLLIFRLCEEWFALSAGLCSQVLSPLKAHTLPHRSNDTLLGIVNVRGQMLLKVSLQSVLSLQTDHQAFVVADQRSQARATQAYKRMVVLEKAAANGPEVWVFEVDELEGIHSVSLDTLESPPAGVEASTETHTRQIFLWQERRINWLDDSRLFEALRQCAL